MITEILLATILQIISSAGYAGIFALMLAESTLLPVPSEAVLPFAGYLVAQGQMNLITVIIIATLGTIAGALISYFIGKCLGKEIVLRYGKYFFISKKELETAHGWFDTHGDKTIFLCRFIPIIRHVISLPAGTAQMPLKKFIAYTALGGLCWNTILVFVGIQLQKNWSTILGYTSILDTAIVIAIVLAAVYLILKHKKKSITKPNKKAGK